MTDGLTGLGRRSALAMVGAGISGLATIATLLVASHTLSRTEAGQFFVAISLFAIVQGIASMGLETGLQYFVPTLTPRASRVLVNRVATGSFVAGAVIAVLAFVVAGPLGSLLGDAESGDATDIIRVTALVLPIAGLYEIAAGALSATDRVLVVTVADRIVRPLSQVAGMLVAAAASWGASGAVLAWAIPHVLVIVAAAVFRRRPGQVGHAVDVVPVEEFRRYSAPRGIARVAQTLTQRLDVIILAAVYPLADAAVYGTVSRCMIAGAFIATALRQTVQPQLRRLIVRGEPAAVKETYGASTTWLVLVTWPVYLAMMAYAPLVMRAFGEDYVRGSDALVLLCAAMLVASGCGMVDVVLLMLGRSWLSTIITLTALGLNIVLNLLLAPQWGMIGSAIAWVVAILTTNLWPLRETARVGIHPGGGPLVTAMSTAVITIAGPLLLTRALFGTGLLSFLGGAVLASLLYVGSLAVLRRRVLLDRLVGDLRRRRPARSAVGA